MAETMFEGIPDPEANRNPRRLMWVGLVVILFVGGLQLSLYLLTPRSVQWSIADGKLRIRTLLGHEEFPLGGLDAEDAQVVDFSQAPSWRPESKQYGYSGAGFDAGIFRLRNGRSVYLYLTSENTAVFIPRRDHDFPVLIGVRDPSTFITVLKRVETR